MDIKDIKQSLNITQVLSHYSLQPDKNGLLKCPFHEDKTASLQLYLKTNTWHCFGCGATGDQVEFCSKMEKDKHKGILRASSLMYNVECKMYNEKPIQANHQTDPLVRVAILTKMFSYFKAAVYNSPPAKEYLKTRSIDPTKIEVGYNSGQFPEEFRYSFAVKVHA